MANPVATRDTIIYEGVLKKKSPKSLLGLHPWQERYFVLWGHQICYYKKKEEVCDDEKCLGYLLVENMRGVEMPPGKRPERFNIILEGHDRQFELLADREDTANKWMNAVKGVLKSYGKKPVPISPQGGTGADAKFWKPSIHKKLMQRRAAIISTEAPVDDLKSGRKFDKTAEISSFLLEGIKRAAVTFAALDNEERNEVVKSMWVAEFSKLDRVISDGDQMRVFYVVVKGSLDCVTVIANELKDDDGRSSFKGTQTQTTMIRAGDYFGEVALLHETVSPHTVTAREATLCYGLDRSQYKKMVAVWNTKRFEQRIQFLRKSEIFGDLPDDLIKKIAEALEEKVYRTGEVIIRQEDTVESFYVLTSGAVSTVMRDGKEIRRYEKPGEYFGEREVYVEGGAAATIATTDVTSLFLTRKDLDNLMGKMDEKVEKGVRKFSVLGSNSSNIGAQSRGAGGAGQDAQATSKQYGNIKMHFGQTAAARAAQGVEEAKAGKMVSRERVCPVKGLQDLQIIGTLGRGTFGHVQLVADASQVTYALKAVNKAHVVRHNQISHILNERAVMIELEHPFVIRLFGTFRNKNYLYFLLEPCLGGELFSVLRNRDRFDVNTARFYAGIVVSVFQYMHSLDTLYRDLKPENLLMDNDGYLKITDFGFAKKTKDRTYTFCGTPDYLAPEIVATAGHHTGADWWTLGVLIFEMLAGYTPFYDEAGPTSMYSKILAGKLYFPSHFSPAAQNLVASLLQTKPTRRLGVMSGGAEQIKKHEWFEGFDWDALIQRQIPAPIQVSVKGKFDLSNFDSYPEEESPSDEYQLDPMNPTWDNAF